MKVSLYEDELWPYYDMLTPFSHYGTVVEVDATTLARWKRALKSFGKVQDEMKALYDEALRP